MSEIKELSWNEPAVITHLAFSSVLVCFFKSIQATIIPFSVINIMLFSIISFPLFWEELDKTQERWIGIFIGILVTYIIYLFFLLYFSKIRYKKGRYIIVDNKQIMCIGMKIKLSRLSNLCISKMIINENEYLVLTGKYKNKQYIWGIDSKKIQVRELCQLINSSSSTAATPTAG
ncbi:MAG: hypothetical protein ILM98_02445 [Kiritimatiellae bacterium]|nr:hypothetical protein [Kiritimatiellia bacterium]